MRKTRLLSRFCVVAGTVTAGFALPLLVRGETPITQHLAGRPSVESALAAEEALAKAMRDNDADAMAGLLADDWAVISAHGDVAEGKDVFPSGIRSGVLTRTAYEISEPRVRVDGHTAVVTTKVHLAGIFRGKAFDVTERVSDIFMWHGGHWEAILTHETFIPAKQGS